MKQRVQQEHPWDNWCSVRSWGWESGIIPEPREKDFSLLGEMGVGTTTTTHHVWQVRHLGYHTSWGMNTKVCFASHRSDPRAPRVVLGYQKKIGACQCGQQGWSLGFAGLLAQALGNQRIWGRESCPPGMRL